MKRLIPILAALALTGCATYPAELLVEQTQLLQKAADQNRAVAANMQAEYVNPAIAGDEATINAAFVADIADWRTDPNLTDAEVAAKVEEAVAKKLAANERNRTARNAPLVGLETSAAAIEGSIDRLKATAAKINE